MAERSTAPAISIARGAVAEGVGTALLLATVVGSGIMGERLAGGNAAIALLANSIATGAALVALITALAPISGAHFNPLVTLLQAAAGALQRRAAAAYAGAQLLGAFAGVATAHAMFGLPAFTASQHARAGGPQWFSEAVATFGLLAIVAGCARSRTPATAAAVGAYVAAAYWFTASTAFANPAVTLARCATDTFAGIRPADAPGFLLGQAAGALAGGLLFRWLLRGAAAPGADAGGGRVG